MYCDPNIAELGKGTRFKAGNPYGGRKPGSKSLVRCLENALEMVAQNIDPLTKKIENRQMSDWIAIALAAKAASGDVSAIREAMDRIDGKATQKVELTGKDGEPLQVNHTAHLETLYGGMMDAFEVKAIDVSTE